MKKLFVSVFMVVVLASTQTCAAERANLSGVTRDMLTPGFWISRAAKPNKILMNRDEIAAFSNEIKHTDKTHCVDVFSLPVMLTAEQLASYINTFDFPKEERYVGDIKADAKHYEQINRLRDVAAVRELNIVRFGTAIRDTQIRAFPTDDPSYTEPNYVEFDMNVESVAKIWEPLALLHTSHDGRWMLAQSPSVLGWVKSEDIAVIGRDALKKYLDMDFLVITGNRIFLDRSHTSPQAERTELTMGTRLPLVKGVDIVDGITADYSNTAILPGRDKDGNFIEKRARIPLHCDTSVGYLPYTQANIIKQAFKMLGERYGWGGLWNARDCSAYIKDIYLTFGVELPRNSRSQTRIPSTHFDTKDMQPEKKELLILKLPAGAILQMPGHIVLYLGRFNGRPYIIHDAYAYGESGLKGTNGRTKINCVAISDLQITRKNGSTFLEAIHNINVIKSAGK